MRLEDILSQVDGAETTERGQLLRALAEDHPDLAWLIEWAEEAEHPRGWHCLKGHAREDAKPGCRACERLGNKTIDISTTVGEASARDARVKLNRKVENELVRLQAEGVPQESLAVEYDSHFDCTKMTLTYTARIVVKVDG
jgi:hypothetical protein